MTTGNLNSIRSRLEAVTKRISEAEQRFGRTPGAVGLIAVSKTRPAANIRAALACGQQRFGESYLQEALTKIEQLAGLGVEWHFLGPIQSNKTKPIAQHFHWVHSVDRPAIARRLSEQRPPELAPLNVCLQVNISAEPSKSGVPPGHVLELASVVVELPRLQLRGLMAIPAAGGDFGRQRIPFRALRDLQQQLVAEGFALDTLSMGMSNDMEAAIAEGATLVRIGTDVFGLRQRK